MKNLIKIGMVIVTYNRLDMLKKVLKKCDKQTKIPQYILIVNNASNDGTFEYLSYWKSLPSKYQKIIINLDFNSGGSGGFYSGLETAERLDADWIWVSDDDAVPNEDALREAEKYLSANAHSLHEISAICGMVINNGHIDITHRRWIKQYGIFIKESKIREDAYNDCFELNAFSYVGTIINKNILLKAGLPEKDFFIWWDDTEHSLRLSRYGKIICVPDIKIFHDIKSETESLTWKDYYGFRNRAYSYKKLYSKKMYTYYYYSELIKSYIKIAIGHNIQYNKIKIQAIKDANNDKLGLHSEYRPGWFSNNC